MSHYSDRLRVGRPGLNSRQGQDFLLYFTASRPALVDTQNPIRWVPAAVFPRVKGPGHEADYSPPSSAVVSSGGAIPPRHHTSLWRGA
jgi:hypothetical protein